MPTHQDRVRGHYEDRWWEHNHELHPFPSYLITTIFVVAMLAILYGIVESML